MACTVVISLNPTKTAVIFNNVYSGFLRFLHLGIGAGSAGVRFRGSQYVTGPLNEPRRSGKTYQDHRIM